jgi:hypothetical protein
LIALGRFSTATSQKSVLPFLIRKDGFFLCPHPHGTLPRPIAPLAEMFPVDHPPFSPMFLTNVGKRRPSRSHGTVPNSKPLPPTLNSQLSTIHYPPLKVYCFSLTRSNFRAKMPRFFGKNADRPPFP